MAKATATTQKPASDRAAEFQTALDAYIVDYRRHHRNLRRPAIVLRDSISGLVRGARIRVLGFDRP